MRKRIVKTTVFFLILILLLIALSFLFMPKDNTAEAGVMTKTNHLNAGGISGMPENSIDVLFIGDSLCYSAFIPAKLWKQNGYTSYNCGTAGQYLNESLRYLKTAEEKQQIRVVVLETNLLFRRTSPETSWYAFLSEKIPAVEYHDRWKSVSKEDLTLEKAASYYDKALGYYHKTEVKAADGNTEDVSDDEKEIGEAKGMKIPVMNRLFFRELVSYCREHNIQLLLVSSPSLKNWSAEKHKAVSKLAEKNNLSFFDMNDETGVEESLCMDWSEDSRDKGDHLNDFGAKKATIRLGIYLSEITELEDRSGFEWTDIWEEADNR